MRLTVDVATGHKTGYYLDQRDNRRKLREWVRMCGSHGARTVTNSPYTPHLCRTYATLSVTEISCLVFGHLRLISLIRSWVI